MSGRYLFNNHARSTLDGAITDSALSILVAAGEGALFPLTNFKINIGTEIILVASRSTDTFTITSTAERGYDGTTAAAHSDADAVLNVASAEDYLGAGPRDSALDYRYRRLTTETVHAFDDEFDGAALDAAWVYVNPTGTFEATQGGHQLSMVFQGQSANDCGAILKPIGSVVAPFTIEAAISQWSHYENYSMHGVVITDGTDVGSNCIGYMPYIGTSGNYGFSFWHGTLTNVATAAINVSAIWTFTGGYKFVRVVNTAANTFGLAVSPNGFGWTTFAFGTVAKTMTPTHAGFWGSRWGGGAEKSVLSAEYIRLTEANLLP